MTVFSSPEQLSEIRNILANYIRLPFSHDTIPGAIMEAVLAHIHEAKVLNTYDFADVIKTSKKCGWQIKSTKASTPVTWKRAKIPNQLELMKVSEKSKDGLQTLGDAIIKFCNDHAAESLRIYNLDSIGYSRLVIHPNRQVTYFEKLLCTRDNPLIFKGSDFVWRWSVQKNTKKKEQLPALHGFKKSSGKKLWAWHGRGENQLHFSGESEWWPQPDDKHSISFILPSPEEKMSLEGFMDLLSRVESPI